MSDIALDIATHDVALDAGKMSLVRGAEAIAQSIRIRLQFWLGEWFLDRREGVPLRSVIFAKGVTAAVIQNVIFEVVQETPRVDSVRDFDVQINKARRSVSVAFQAISDTGALLDFSKPFIVEAG